MRIFKEREIDRDWTLFLDRDGTINRRLMNDYVKTIEQFEFLPGAVKAIKQFYELFKYIIIVTNQQGIGKELMTHEDLHKIHGHMSKKLSEVGVSIAEILYCPHLAEQEPMCRKPNPGMAFQAGEIYKDIVFKKSVMVGDTASDIEFGKRLNMHTVLISSTPGKGAYYGADMVVYDLLEFSEYLVNY